MIRPILAGLCLLCLAGAARADGLYYVNGQALAAEVVAALEQNYGLRLSDARPDAATRQAIKALYGVDVAGNRFWYDKLSGAWGYEGLPPAGQVAPFMNIGGPLSADASNGESNVTVNGRRLHHSEIRYLIQQFGSVVPGRYYLFANGNYGFEGGPVLGNLWANRRGSSALSGRDKFGSVLGSGDFTGYIPSGSGGVGVTCAPDGGCIYD